jgi:hypothetical protein
MPACQSCGFVLLEEERPSRSPRARKWWIAGAAVAAAGAAVAAVLIARDPAPTPPTPVSAGLAETRLERQLGTERGGPRGHVTCPGAIQAYRVTRCRFLYSDGDTQLMLVTLRSHGELDIDVPYPAQRRPG